MLRPTHALCALAFGSLTAFASAQNCLNTISPFANNNSGSVGGAVYFDMTVSASILIQSLDMNFTAVAGTPVGVDVYLTPGTSVGNQGNAAVWTLVGSDNGAGLAAGLNLHTALTMTTPILVNSGSYGVALVARGSGHAYTNGTGANQNFNDSFITLSLGSALNVPFTGTAFTPRVWNGTICYLPASGLYPNFTANVRAGDAPLAVNFTDTTYTSDPNGVLAWSWDLDGDGNPDSTAQNPSFNYTTEGVYNVSLTAFDIQHGQVTATKNGFIEVDLVHASFTPSFLPANLVAFTDTSAGHPTSWAWDLNGDGLVDSTVQNPAYQYPGPGIYNVTLTVTDALGSDSKTVPVGISVVPIPGFGRTFSSATLTRGLWFQAPVRFSLVGLKVPDESAHGLQNVAVYRQSAPPPAYAGSASGGLEFLSLGQSSANTIPCVVSFDAGEYVCILGACGDATTMRSSYATPVGPFASSVLGQPTTLTRLLTQTNLVSANGTGAYSSEAAFEIGRVEMAVSAAAGLSYGAGTPSGAGPAAPTMKTTALPILGATATVTVDQQDASVLGFLLIGFGRTNLPTPFGTLLVNNIGVTVPLNGGVPMTPGSYPFSLTVPLTPALNGAGPVNLQNVNIVLSSSTASMSNGQEWWLAF